MARVFGGAAKKLNLDIKANFGASWIGMSPEISDVELTILMPALNEAETVSFCVDEALRWLEKSGVKGEVLIADNGSTDGTQALAEKAGARVVPVSVRGYGAALATGISASRGRYVIMADADASYDFSRLDAFWGALVSGRQLVMGNRFLGGIAPGAMPPLHYYLGNPVLSFLGRLFFRSPIGDFHCGLRGFERSAIQGLNLQTTGMEFASEMVVKATLARLNICEVATTLRPDGRSRAPHLRSWRDGWRHLRFLLLYCPRWLFLAPGAVLFLVGSIISAWLLGGPRRLGPIELDIHTLLAACGLVIIGYQAIVFALLTKVFAIAEGLLPDDPQLNRVFRYITLEVGLLAGGILVAASLAGGIVAWWHWRAVSYGGLRPSDTMRVMIPVVVAAVIGSQTILASFYFSILGLRRK